MPGGGTAIGGAIESGGNKNVVVAEIGHFELRRENADDGGGPPVERNGATGEIEITGKARAPQAVGDEGDTRRVGAVFIAGEIAAEEGLNAEGWKESRFDESAFQADRILFGEIAVRTAGDK